MPGCYFDMAMTDPETGRTGHDVVLGLRSWEDLDAYIKRNMEKLLNSGKDRGQNNGDFIPKEGEWRYYETWKTAKRHHLYPNYRDETNAPFPTEGEWWFQFRYNNAVLKPNTAVPRTSRRNPRKSDASALAAKQAAFCRLEDTLKAINKIK